LEPDVQRNQGTAGARESDLEHKTWREAVAHSYTHALEEIDGKSPRWETYDDHWNFPPDNDWRLWESIEVLDITHSLLRDLTRRARRKHKQELAIRIDQIRQNVNLTLFQLDPDNWRRHRFMDFKDDRRRLQTALKCLQQAFMLFRDGYEQISLEVEASRRKDCWVMGTPAIYRQLRDSSYALEKYLACAKDGATE